MTQNLIKLTVTFFLSCLILVNSWGQTDDQQNFICNKEFQAVIQSNETLQLAGVDVIKLDSGETYLLALGTTTNLAKEDPGITAKLETKKVAEAKAQRASAEFYQSDVSSDTKLTELEKSEKVINNGVKQKISTLIRIRQEIIEERSTIVLRGSKTVATWYSDGGSAFNLVIAIPVETSKK